MLLQWWHDNLFSDSGEVVVDAFTEVIPPCSLDDAKTSLAMLRAQPFKR
jgi:hypothetical protein